MKKLFATLSLAVVLAMSIHPTSAKDTLQSNPTKGCYDDLESYPYKVVETNHEEGFKRIKIEGKEAERFIQNSNMPKPPEHAEIGAVFLKLPLTEQKPSIIANPQSSGNQYLKPTGASKACGEIFKRTTALGPSEYTFSAKTTTKVTATATVGMDYALVKSTFGLTVDETREVSDQMDNTIPAGEYWSMVAATNVNINRFDVMEKGWIWDSKTGEGSVTEPIGVCFYYYKI
ncbi:hypothetical protein NLX71_10580 [Paenibacillus sp. MZ04-78.2]|uniref:hypothetical protein n=1 Tax=Paenibacillus sp. MZ04-78.2 TaxID=2962034 RepID=UPI0020B66867|nr:hypothetical protein [Paenibacillus sp. MZ04-78.2]MCP3773755.1 hypothetical protein [Paenibacillus sp. MZ04-78.2]